MCNSSVAFGGVLESAGDAKPKMFSSELTDNSNFQTNETHNFLINTFKLRDFLDMETLFFFRPILFFRSRVFILNVTISRLILWSCFVHLIKWKNLSHNMDALSDTFSQESICHCSYPWRCSLRTRSYL